MSDWKFPKDFMWGAATASYQIEGAAGEDGKGESIWDRFCHTPGMVMNNDTGDIACDHYHRYREDIALMEKIGLKGYRFSIAWPRIYPQGKGAVNQKGLDFYQRLVDELLEHRIEPIATLYHWDLPQVLQDTGGWANRDTIQYFTDYADAIFSALGDRVKSWITFNEPWVIAFLGYEQGKHAPGIHDMPTALQVSHHLNLSHAAAVNAYRAGTYNDGEIGITLNMSTVYPATESRDDIDAAKRHDGFMHRWFLEPALAGTYPEDMLALYLDQYGSRVIHTDDMKIISSAKPDFIGLNYYTRNVIRSNEYGTFNIGHVQPEGNPYTDMGWEICPDGLYDLLMRFKNDYNNPKIYITENGAAFKDKVESDGSVHDYDRIAYLKEHFKAAHRAIRDGCNLKGYFVWSLLDNFEWAFGYTKRFGLIHVDYNTLKRTPKKSAEWYGRVIAANSCEVE